MIRELDENDSFDKLCHVKNDDAIICPLCPSLVLVNWTKLLYINGYQICCVSKEIVIEVMLSNIG